MRRSLARQIRFSSAYATLGVTKTATQDEVKKAYRKLVMKHHPDRNGGDDKKFKEINEAYSQVSDTEKRKAYDMFGGSGGSPGGFPGGGFPGGGFPGGGFPGGMNVNMNMSDMGSMQDLLKKMSQNMPPPGAGGPSSSGPGSFYSLNLDDIFGKGGFPNMSQMNMGGFGGGPGTTQQIQQIITKPDGSRIMRTTSVSFGADGKPNQKVTETPM